MKKVLFAEDHSIVIRGMKMIFEREFKDYSLDVVHNSIDLMKMLKNNAYELAIIDLHLEDGDTLHLLTTITNIYKELSILVFSANSEELYAQKLYNEGINGYLSKQTGDAEIVFALTEMLGGKKYMSENFKKFLLSKKATALNPFDKLTQREMEVLNLLAKGLRPVDICKELNLQPSTVATYKVKLFYKLQVNSIFELHQLLNNYKPVA